MKHQIIKVDNHYEMTVEVPFTLTNDAVWHSISTTNGFQEWFPELHIEPNSQGERQLVFRMDGFEEVMAITRWEDGHLIGYQWDQAFVTFEISIDKVLFKEVIPQNYKNEFTNAIGDMAGWSTHLERLSYLWIGEVPPEIDQLVKKWNVEISEEIAKL